MNFLAAALLFLASAAHADSIKFSCTLFNPPLEQGQERWMKFAFADGAIDFKIASPESDYVSPVMGMMLSGSGYDDQSSSASASWSFPDGRPALEVSFMYFGNFWGGHVHFSADVDTPNLKFKIYDEIDLRCEER